MWKNSMVSCGARSPLLAFAGLTACVALLAGCSNNPYPAGETARQTIYRALSDDPKTFDPSIAYDVASATIIDVVYPSYFQYHYLKRDPYVLELGIGAAEPKREKWPVQITEKDKAGNTKTVTKMGERWTFKIKPGVRFQDDPCFSGGKGREIVAADFLNSFRRMAAPNVLCPIFPFFGDKIIGMLEFRKKNAALIQAAKAHGVAKPKVDYSIPIEGLQTDPADPYTFRIILNQPYPQLRYLMAMHFTSPLAHEVVETYGDENLGKDVPDGLKLSRHPVGCGPFMMTEYIKKSKLILQANPNYREEFYPTEGAAGDREAGMLADAGKRLPLVQKIEFDVIRESITSFNQFLQGYEDLAGVSQQNFQQVMTSPGELSPEMKERGVGLHRDKGVDVHYFSFNMDDPTYGGLDDKHRKLRQAISLALDSQEMIDLLDQGLGVPAQFMVSPGLFGYDEKYRNPYRQFDPSLKKAKELLAEAGYPDGIDPKSHKPLVLTWDNLNTSPAGLQATGLITRQLTRLGINVVSNSWLYPAFEDRLDNGNFQFMDFGWVADYPDPENFVFLLDGPNSAKKANGPNYANYANPEYDKLFEQMRVMDDGPPRQAVIDKMRTIVQEDCPWVPTLHSETYALTQSWLKNYKPHPVAMDGAKYWQVDGPRRAELQAKWNRPNYWPAIVVFCLLLLGAIPALNVVHARTHRRVRRSSEETR